MIQEGSLTTEKHKQPMRDLGEKKHMQHTHTRSGEEKMQITEMLKLNIQLHLHE